MSPKRDGIDELLSEVLLSEASLEDANERARQSAVERFEQELELELTEAAGERLDPRSPRRRQRGSEVVALALVALLTIVSGGWFLWRSSGVAPPATQDLRIDFSTYDYGTALEVAKTFEQPRLVTASRTDPALAGETMASGETFDPDRPIAASGLFPLGSILELRFGERTIVIPVRDSAGTDLVLSRGATTALGLSPEAGRFSVWVRLADFEGKTPL